MKQSFPGFYRPTEEEFADLWSKAIFIFDANVLLDLYSYPEDVRKVYFSVLSKLGERLWIPYQVGLEFHRNRFSRIKQENKRIGDLLKAIRETEGQIRNEVENIELEKRNIGITNIDNLLRSVQESHENLVKAVQLACEKLPPISLEDPIGNAICELFEGRIGTPPVDQAALDSMLQDGEDRYDKKMPPGFMDKRKADAHSYDRGLTYKDKFGDLILWRQILNHASQNKISAIVFVTRDSKKDWWWEEDGKTLGPLPGLVQEMADGGVKPFWLYTPDMFLQNAETYLKATEVTPEAVKQVKDLSDYIIIEPKTFTLDKEKSDSFIQALKIFLRDRDVSAISEDDLRVDPHKPVSWEGVGKWADFDKRYLSSLAHPTSQQTPISSKTPAVSVEQDADSGVSQDYNRGIIRINILRDTPTATGSGKLAPSMSGIPALSAKLEKAPDGYSSERVKFSAGTGTSFDFNINIKSTDYKISLPLGEYVFSYEAKCNGD